LPFDVLTVNPNEVDWPAARLLLELAGFMTMTLAWGQVGLPFQVAEITWPEPSVTVEVQLLIALLPAVMVTWPLNTPFHCWVSL
jgi:hypothetical protein